MQDINEYKHKIRKMEKYQRTQEASYLMKINLLFEKNTELERQLFIHRIAIVSLLIFWIMYLI